MRRGRQSAPACPTLTKKTGTMSSTQFRARRGRFLTLLPLTLAL